MGFKEWELDRNMFDNGEYVGALFGNQDQDELDAEKIKSDYDKWIIEIQNT